MAAGQGRKWCTGGGEPGVGIGEGQSECLAGSEGDWMLLNTGSGGGAGTWRTQLHIGRQADIGDEGSWQTCPELHLMVATSILFAENSPTCMPS